MALESDAQAASGATAPLQVKKPGGILVFLPLLIAVIGLAGLFLGLSPAGLSARQSSGYGVDEIQTGAIPSFSADAHGPARDGGPGADPAIVGLDR